MHKLAEATKLLADEPWKGICKAPMVNKYQDSVYLTHDSNEKL